MEDLIFIDTHVAVWLYAGDLDLFTPEIRTDLDVCQLQISPAVVLEIQYLHEIERLTVPADEIVAELQRAIGLQISDIPFVQVIAEALRQSWTRDPFDRIIVAQAALGQDRLLTRDGAILEHYEGAYWR